MDQKWIGKSVKRKEDYKLLTGQGMYVGDMKREGMLHACFLRSPHAHTKIKAVYTEQASKLPGIFGIWTASDLSGLGHIQPLAMLPDSMWEAVNLRRKEWSQPALAEDKVRFVGEPIAVVLADSRYLAEDAIELIEVEYEILEPIPSVEKSLQQDAAKLNETWPDNIQAQFEVVKGDWKETFQGADFIIEREYQMGRSAGITMETRGIMAEIDVQTGQLLVWSSTQVAHFIRNNLVSALGCTAEDVRVIAPHVGGGYGVKGNVYPEDLVIPYLARKLKRPIQWLEDRREHLLTASHARDQKHFIRAAFKKDGTLLGVDDRYYVDSGAYNLWETCVVYNTAAHLLGPYRCPAYRSRGFAVLTNKSPSAPYRGAGRPEAVFAFERLLDEAANQLSLDRMEIRKKNLISSEEMPYDVGIIYRDGRPVVYDSGEFLFNFERVLQELDYEAFLKKQEQLRKEGKYLGLGLACFVEGTGIGPFEGARVMIQPNGDILVATGAASQGQGHETSFSQVCADLFDVEWDRIQIRGGDTGLIPKGIGTFASRSAVVAGNAIYEACRQLKVKLLGYAAERYGAAPETLQVKQGMIVSTDSHSPEVKVSLEDFACQFEAEGKLHELEETYYFHPETVTYSNGVHAAVVEVDIHTGKIDILEYVVAHDAGLEINPQIVEGQLYGGLLQGLGGALMEELPYSPSGQLNATTFKEYLMPNVYNLPSVKLIQADHHSPRNPLGVKGTGEGGTICPGAAMANAVSDALKPFGVQISELPLTPDRIKRSMRDALSLLEMKA